MAKLETPYAIAKKLLSTAQVTAVVGDRVYPLLEMPQNHQRPAIMYSATNAEHAHYMGGAAGHAFKDIDLYISADTDHDMRSLATIVRKTLDGFTGTVTVGADSTDISYCLLQSEQDNVQDPTGGGEEPLRIMQMEFRVGAKTDTTH